MQTRISDYQPWSTENVGSSAIAQWQLEDAINAIKDSERRLAKLEHQHSREKEELQLIIAAHEHSASGQSKLVQQATEKLEEIRTQMKRRLAAAKEYVAKQKADCEEKRAALAKERAVFEQQIKDQKQRIDDGEHQQAQLEEQVETLTQENSAFARRMETLCETLADHEQQVADQSAKLKKQAILISDLTTLSERQEAELADAQQMIVSLRDTSQLHDSKRQEEIERLQQVIRSHGDREKTTHRELESLKLECGQKDDDLLEAMRLCDEFEGKLQASADKFRQDREGLEETVKVLRSQSQDQASRVKQLEKERQDLEEQFTVKLNNLTEESQQKSKEAEQHYESQISGLQSTIDDLEAKAQQRAEEVRQLSEKIVGLNDEYAEKFAAAHQRIQEEVTRASGEHQAEIDQLQSVIGSLEAKVETEAANAQKSQEEANAARNETLQIRQESAEIEKEKAAKISSLAETIRRSQERVKEQKLEEAKQLKIDVVELREQLEAKDHELETTRDDGLRFKHEARRLAQRLASHLDQHAKQREHLCRRIEELQKQIEMMQDKDKRAA